MNDRLGFLSLFSIYNTYFWDEHDLLTATNLYAYSDKKEVNEMSNSRILVPLKGLIIVILIIVLMDERDF